MSKMKIKYIECSGTSRKMGRQYGEGAREEILQALSGAAHKDFLSKIENCAERIGAIKKNLELCLPEVSEEIKGIAEGCGASVEQILLLNHVDTISDEWVQACTPVGLVSDKDGIIVAKNNDGSQDQRMQYPFVVRKSIPEKGIPMLQCTYAGWLSGLDAINAEGLANTHGSVGSVFDKSGDRVDIRLATYHLMRNCSKVKEFCAKLSEMSLTGKGFNIIAGDAKRKSVIVEAAVPLIACRAFGQKFFYTTNHFISNALENADMRSPEGKVISTYRLGYLDWVAKTNPPESLDDVKNILSSHEPWAPCRHGGAHVSETYWSQICLPEKRKMFVSHGAPCEVEYSEYNI
jgi:hypothetical protein